MRRWAWATDNVSPTRVHTQVLTNNRPASGDPQQWRDLRLGAHSQEDGVQSIEQRNERPHAWEQNVRAQAPTPFNRPHALSRHNSSMPHNRF
eukprot:3523864-Rhodomonas_salina.4